MNTLRKSVFSDLQLMIIATAVVFITAIPRAMSDSYEILIETFLFVLTLATAYFLYKSKVTWIFLYFFIIAIYYSPLFLVFHDIKNSPILDTAVALSFFIIALFWEKILDIHRIK